MSQQLYPEKELQDNITHFKTLDDDTLVFLLSVITQNPAAIAAITIVLNQRGGAHNRNLLQVAPECPN